LPPTFVGSFHQPLILAASWTQPARLDPDSSRSPKPGSCHHSSGSFRGGRRRGLTWSPTDLSQARPRSSKPHHAQLRTAVSGMGACASGTRDPSTTRSFRSYVSLFETGHGSGGTQRRGPFLIRPRSGSGECLCLRSPPPRYLLEQGKPVACVGSRRRMACPWRSGRLATMS